MFVEVMKMVVRDDCSGFGGDDGVNDDGER